MNRREFITTATAAASIPALPAFSFASATPVTSSSARYWAVYMTELNGDITPATLGKMTGLSTSKAATIKADLIAQNILKPTGFAAKATVVKSLKPDTALKKANRLVETLLDEPQTEQAASELEEAPEEVAELGNSTPLS